jgi:hypothetical protein
MNHSLTLNPVMQIFVVALQQHIPHPEIVASTMVSGTALRVP